MFPTLTCLDDVLLNSVLAQLMNLISKSINFSCAFEFYRLYVEKLLSFGLIAIYYTVVVCCE